MIKTLLLTFAIYMLASCSSTELLQQMDSKEIITAPEYKIGVGDQLSINVWKNPELSLSVTVRPDGKISVPLVGDAQAVGLSAEALAAELNNNLKKFIRSPEVTVIVSSAMSAEFLSRVRITGAVQTPLSIPYREGMTVLDLVLQAGGLNPFSNGDNAILYRKTDSGIKRYSIKLKRIIKQGDISTNYELRPSDILIVPESIF
ncbi:polysaccharide export protein [Psychromonas ingrahamii 37]|uniref:Polysaccharide export protein n=1 Tax=Psychromonas ingrahamii (strain DSM 17664 / CCUG 51855 / 37) TaxID=357804 RepID=A1SS23_PSYIN|nr:XrtA/PEP-CTERM system exopolysaccharide export protein [Psychromonas ingrahamii]ABM02288.1 polysaccharide export protein [Psychromonas ingrahamii 37]